MMEITDEQTEVGMVVLAIVGALFWLALMVSYVVLAVRTGREIMDAEDE